MNILKNLRYPIVGWIAGIVVLSALIWVWPKIFPGIVQAEHYNTTDPGFPFIFGTTLLVATPVALIGGLVGSRVPREGGRTEQTVVAALVGGILTLPFICVTLWLFSGY